MFEELEKFILSVMKERKLPGSSVSVVHDKEIVWSKGFGYANVEDETPATPDTVYRCASVTKTVVTAGLLQWMEKGRFRLDDPVNEHLRVKIQTEYAEQPTIRDLLTHQSGLPTYTTPIFYDPSEVLDIEEWVRRVARTVRPPKQVYAYSNPAFDIVGYLIGLFSGGPYDIYMKKNVLVPLEMHSSAFRPEPELQHLMAMGYGRSGSEGVNQPVKPYISGMIPEAACGALYSTATDLAHFVIAQLNGGVYKERSILKEETMKEMHKLQAAAGNSSSGVALTWNRSWHHGRLILRHTGGKPGWAAHVAFYPDLKMGVVWLSNLQDGSSWRPPAPTALRILAGDYRPFDPQDIRTEKIPDDWEKIAGTYGSPGQLRTIRIEDGCLVLGQEGGAKVYLEKMDATRYVVHGGLDDGYEVTFEHDEKGRIKQYDLGTSIVPRYLVGFWRVKHTMDPQLYDLVLDIESETSATATGMHGERTPISDFRVEDHRITGSFKTSPPASYLGWTTFTGNELNVSFDLLYDSNELVGLVFVTREGARARGAGTQMTLSRS